MMMTLVVVTVYVAVLMAGVPSAAQAVDQTDALATLQNGVVMQCKKTHTGGCTNHRQISISLKRNVDSVSRCLEECTQDKRCEGFSFGKTNTPVDRTCILYREGCQKDSTNQRWDFYSKKDCITSGTSGVSLKEYQNEVDILKKSIDDQHRDIETLREKLRSQDALLDNQRSLIQGLKGDLSEEKTEREKSVQEEKESREQSDSQIQDGLSNVIDDVLELDGTVVKRCSNESDCPAGYEGSYSICSDGWCNWARYKYRANSKCAGAYISPYATLQEARANCHGSCGCIRDLHCDGGPWFTYVGTRVLYSWKLLETVESCSWVKN